MEVRSKPVARGFTLVEMMIVITIIIVAMLAAIPNVARGLKDQPVLSLTREIASKFEYAQIRAVNDFRAFGVLINVATSDRGVISVHGSVAGPACNAIDWVTPVTDTVDLDARWFNREAEADLHIVSVTPGTVTRVCFTPDGRMLNGLTLLPIAAAASSAYGAGDLEIAVQRFMDDSVVPDGPMHHVIVPYSGKPRMLFGDDSSLGEGEGGA